MNFFLTLFQIIIIFNITNAQVYDVIVVGGGVSGLSACVQLISKGIKNILLIEANNRLGGRINTITYGICYYYFYYLN